MKRTVATAGFVYFMTLVWAPSGLAAPILNPNNGHYYEAIVSGGINWFDAKIAAESLTFMAVQGHLATVTTQSESDFLFNNFVAVHAGLCECWTGGFQPPGSPEPAGGWQWVTGEPFVFTNWAGGEPNEHHFTEDSITINGDGKWNDHSRTAPLATYFVEYEGQ